MAQPHDASDPGDRSVLRHAFSSSQIEQQLEEDRAAWRGIIGILIGIVSFGITLAAIVVWAISRWA